MDNASKGLPCSIPLGAAARRTELKGDTLHNSLEHVLVNENQRLRVLHSQAGSLRGDCAPRVRKGALQISLNKYQIRNRTEPNRLNKY